MLPAQPQLQGPEPDTEEAVPAAQRLVVGAAESLVPFELPQDPLTGEIAPMDDSLFSNA